MKKNKIISILMVLLLLVMIIVVVYYFINKKILSSTDTIVSDLNTDVTLDTSDEDIDWSTYEEKYITLTESITITEEAVYYLSGEIDDGVIKIKLDGNVKLVLDNVSITNSEGPAIYVENANMTVIETKSNTTNSISDSSSYTDYEDSVEGAIYSKDDLILQGDGTLKVTGKKGDAIVCKDDLKINSGTYIITSYDDAIRGKDSVYILDGNFTIDSGADGIKSTNDTDSTKGYVKIDNGTFDIDSTLDGIQAETKILISNGTFNITTGGGSSNSSDKSGWGSWGNSTTDSNSAKGIKAKDNIVLSGGTYNINSSDDSIHSNNYVGISLGSYIISSGDDGIHADSELVIDDGDIDITKSYEGLEAKTITINNGNISIVSSDDGLNAAGGNDSSGYNRPGNENSSSEEKSTLTINGGQIYVDAAGDGLDSNGSIYINGGYIIIDGPENSGNGALDYDSECKITSGTLIALGASGMAQGISSSSSQYGVLINFTNSYSSGNVITIVDSNDNEVMSYTSNKSFSSVLFSSNALTKGSYTIKVNGNTYQTFTISNISTTIGNSSMGGANPGGRR